MNLANNIKKIRKENNLSQEQLAEKLGVSRQSVSKWESEQAYPETEKIIQICELFNISMDELLNENVAQVNERKKEKATLNKYIESFLNYIIKTIELFTNMKWSQRIKCVAEQLIYIAIFSVFAAIVHEIGENIIRSIFRVNYLSEIFGSIYIGACFIIGAAIIFQIFKVRYLNYYEIVNDQKDETDDIKITESVEETSVESKKKIIKKEKIIIRDPDHSEYRFIGGLVKCFLMVVKIIMWMAGIFACGTLVAETGLLVMSFLIAESGLLFAGIIVSLLGLIAITVIILVIIYGILFNKKYSKGKLAISFLSCVIAIGIGFGIGGIGFSNMNLLTKEDENYFSSATKVFNNSDMNLISYCGNDITYIPVKSNKIKVTVTYPDFLNCYIEKEVRNGENGIVIEVYDDDCIKEINAVKEMINNRIIPTSRDNISITVYASEKSIKYMKEHR